MYTFPSRLFLAISLFWGIGCSEDSTPMGSEGPSLNEVIAADPKFSMMQAAMDRANLGPTLEGRGPYTVLVPTNEGFEDFLSERGATTLSEIPTLELSRILLPHIIQGRLRGGEITAGYIQTLAIEPNSSNSVTLYVNERTGINGRALLEEIDIEGSNGLIQRIDAVLPYPNLWTHLNANTEFALFFEGLGLVGDTLQSLLENERPFTIFAPDNQAMLDFLSNSEWEDLTQIPRDSLFNILSVHIVPGQNLLSTRFTNNMGLNTLSPDGVILTLVNVADEFLLTADRNRNIPIELVNLQAANGVIHLVRGVASP